MKPLSAIRLPAEYIIKIKMFLLVLRYLYLKIPDHYFKNIIIIRCCTLEENIDLISFSYSIAQYGSKTLTFDNNEEDFEFLFDNRVQTGSVEYNGQKYSSLEYYRDTGFTNSAKQYLFQSVVNAFYHLGTEFKPLIITSSVRTGTKQADIMLFELSHDT